MPSMDDYHWNAEEDYDPVVTGMGASFSTATMIQANDGYGGTNWEFRSEDLIVHVHFQGVSRRVTTVRIKSHAGAELDFNMIRLRNPANKGASLGSLAYYCDGFPNHRAFLRKLHEAMPA